MLWHQGISWCQGCWAKGIFHSGLRSRATPPTMEGGLDEIAMGGTAFDKVEAEESEAGGSAAPAGGACTGASAAGGASASAGTTWSVALRAPRAPRPPGPQSPSARPPGPARPQQPPAPPSASAATRCRRRCSQSRAHLWRKMMPAARPPAKSTGGGLRKETSVSSAGRSSSTGSPVGALSRPRVPRWRRLSSLGPACAM